MKCIVLIIDHKHGRNVSVHATREDVTIELSCHCREWWRKELGDDEPMPKTDDEIISRYFDAVQDYESYETHECEIPAEA